MSTTIMFGSINESRETMYEAALQTHTAELPPPKIPSLVDVVTDFVAPHLTWSTLWFTLLCVFVAFNLKNMPGAWHLRIVNAFRFILRSQRPAVAPRPEHIFQPIITTSTAQLMEIDFNMHKTNSSYFSDTDIARTHLVCTLFSRGIEQMRGGTAAYTGSKQPVFGLALGAVTCSFKREVRPYERYEMWSKILSWDEKWIYIVTHFVKKGAAQPRSYSLYPQQARAPLLDEETDIADDEVLRPRQPADDSKPGKQLHATALSKCVFKSGRKTVSPELMLQMSGLLPVAGASGKAKAGSSKKQQQQTGAMTAKEIEARRVKGLAIAQQLAAHNQQSLEEEFAGDDCEALGRHTDGAGIVGVVNTLMQLAHLKKTQIL